MIDNRDAILNSAKQIATLATELATRGKTCPYHDLINTLTGQIIDQSIDIQKAAGGWTPDMTKARP